MGGTANIDDRVLHKFIHKSRAASNRRLRWQPIVAQCVQRCEMCDV